MNLHDFDIFVVRSLTIGLSKSEQLQLDRILDNDLFYLERYDQLKKSWMKAENFELFEKLEVLKHQDFQNVWGRIEQSKSKSTALRIFHFLKKHNVAAVLAFALLLSSFVLLYRNVPGFGRWKSFDSKGIVASLILPDQSNVTLNHFSEIIYLKDLGKERRVKLSGEGFFKVHHDADKPFTIEAGQASVKVLGTQFDLKVDRVNKTTDIYVTKGTVAFFTKDHKIILNKGEMGHCENGVITKSIVPKTNNFLFWKTGVLTFSNSSLDEVLNALKNNITEIHSFRKLNSATNIRITTRFEKQPLNEIFRELELQFDKKFELKNNVLIISD